MNRKCATLILILLGMTFTGSVSAVEFDELGAVEIRGFVSQGYLISDENNFYGDTENGGTSQFNEVGLNFTSDVSDRLRVGVQFFSRDLGRMGNNDVTLDWAFADYNFKEWLNLRAGLIKLPYALYNTERDVGMLRTFIFLPQSVYNEGWRDSANALNGAGFHGYIPAGIVGNFSYEGYFGNTGIGSEFGVTRLIESAMPSQLGMDVLGANVHHTNAATVSWESIFGLDGLRLVAGANEVSFDANTEYNSGEFILLYSDPDDTSSVVGSEAARTTAEMEVVNFTYSASIEYARGNMLWAAEVMQNDLEFTHPAFVGLGFNDGVIAYKTLGWYSILTYRFADWVELGVAYGEYYANEDDKNGKKSVLAQQPLGRPADNQYKQYQKDLTLAVRFDLSSNWVFKIEGHSIDGGALLLVDENKVDANGFADYEPKWLLGAVKLSYTF